MFRSSCNCDFKLINCLLNRHDVRATIIGYLFSIFMTECLDLNLVTEKCALKDEGISVLTFVSNLFKKMNSDERYRAILKDYLSHNPFNVYKCYQSYHYSGDIYVDECQISCAISSPFSITTEYYSSFDCNLIKLVM